MEASNECLCGAKGCEEEHPEEEDYVALAKKEKPRILRRARSGLKLDVIDRILLRMAGEEVKVWEKRIKKI